MTSRSWKSWRSRPCGSSLAFMHVRDVGLDLVPVGGGRVDHVVPREHEADAAARRRPHDRRSRSSCRGCGTPSVALVGSTRYSTVAFTMAAPPSWPSTATESSVLPFWPSPGVRGHRVVLGAGVHRVRRRERQRDVEARRSSGLPECPKVTGTATVPGCTMWTEVHTKTIAKIEPRNATRPFHERGPSSPDRGARAQDADRDQAADDAGRHALAEELGQRRVGLDLPRDP